MKWFDLIKREPEKDLRIVAAYPGKDCHLVYTASAIYIMKDDQVSELDFECRE